MVGRGEGAADDGLGTECRRKLVLVAVSSFDVSELANDDGKEEDDDDGENGFRSGKDDGVKFSSCANFSDGGESNDMVDIGEGNGEGDGDRNDCNEGDTTICGCCCCWCVWADGGTVVSD